MKLIRKNAKSTLSYPAAWPYGLLMATPMLVWPLAEYLRASNLSLLFLPVVLLLLWVPFLLWDAIRVWRDVELEKRSLQAKFDAEDAELLASK